METDIFIFAFDDDEHEAAHPPEQVAQQCLGAGIHACGSCVNWRCPLCGAARRLIGSFSLCPILLLLLLLLLLPTGICAGAVAEILRLRLFLLIWRVLIRASLLLLLICCISTIASIALALLIILFRIIIAAHITVSLSVRMRPCTVLYLLMPFGFNIHTSLTSITSQPVKSLRVCSDKKRMQELRSAAIPACAFYRSKFRRDRETC